MFFHFVKKGDSIYKLSRQYGVSLNQLIEDNNLKEPYELLVGECLIINNKSKVYTVKKGDTLQEIANKHSISINKLIEDNDIKNKNVLSIGQKLIIDHDNHDKEDGIINGFCYEGISNQTLNKTLSHLDYIAPFACRIDNNGNLVPLNDTRIVNAAKEYDVKPLISITNIKESGGFSSDLASSLLESNSKVNNLISQIKQQINQKRYSGICIDLEYVYPKNKNDYVSFLRKVKQEIPNLPLFVALAPKTSDDQKGVLYEAHDYSQIGRIADYCILMTYEWGYTYGEPMAVAPLNAVRRVVRYAKSRIDNDKLIMGLPNYGYDWELPYKKGNKADSVSNDEAINLAKKYNVEIKFDKNSQTPYFNYTKNGVSHVVHFDDACSYNQKINLALDEELKGLSIWTISTYNPQLYLLIDYYYSKEND